jgi:hypothetical protein
LSKDELSARVEKLERQNAVLRDRNRALQRAASDAEARIAFLETEAARAQREAAQAARRAGGPRGAAMRGHDRDPGDAVPSGVAVLEPEPLTERDKAVLAHMNEALGPHEEDGSGSGDERHELEGRQAGPDEEGTSPGRRDSGVGEVQADTTSGDTPSETTDAPAEADMRSDASGEAGHGDTDTDLAQDA